MVILLSKKGKKKDKDIKDGEPLIFYTRHLEKRIRNLEIEKQLLEAERLRLEDELHGSRNEIDRLREPPLIGAIIIAVIDESKGRYAVRSSTGTFYVVNAGRNINKEKLEVGKFVQLTQRTYEIMDTIDIDLETYKKISRLIYTGQNLLEQLTESQKTLIEYIKKVDKLEEKFEIFKNKLKI